MIVCPSCNHSSGLTRARCPECGAFLGTTSDFINFSAFWICTAAVVTVLTFHYGVMPSTRLGEAVAEVKRRDAESIRQVEHAVANHDIEPVGWDADAFQDLDLVAFSYIPAHENKDRKRLAVWWAYEPGKPGIPPKIASQEEFSDRYLLPLGLAPYVPKAAKLASEQASHDEGQSGRVPGGGGQ